MPRLVVAVRPRIVSIDLLRGAIMILMALDHTRDFFGGGGLNARDVTDPALFLTRWVTHYCAPLFILLAGVSAYLYGTSGRTVADVSRFLLTRGLWLIVIEFTVVRLGWFFSLNLHLFFAQVIWALGVSMAVLSGLVYLPRWAIAAIGLAMIGGHNLFDGIRPEQSRRRRVDLESVAPPRTVAAWACRQAAIVTLSARSLDRRDGGGLCARTGVQARRRHAPAPAAYGSEALTSVGFIVLRARISTAIPLPWTAYDGWLATRAVLHQLRKVSAVARSIWR